MQFDTFLYGKIEVADDAIITFPAGLPGFEQLTRFTLVHETDLKDGPATFTLQSLEDPAIALQIADPTAYGFHYELALTDEESELLKLESPADVAVMLVLFRGDESPKGPIEANLQAPILINSKSRLGLQKVIERLQPNLTLSNLSRPVK